MNVLLVTSWGVQCGIASHSAYLKQAVEQADPSIQVRPDAAWLDPNVPPAVPIDLIHLNYHAGLHSRWTPAAIAIWREAYRIPVLVTYHDTGVPNSDQCKAICAAADYFVVHEPYDDLSANGEYLRMGVPTHIPTAHQQPISAWYAGRRFLGTVGFDFPWKCWNELARVTAAAGWGFYICTPTLTEVRQAELLQLNPFMLFALGLSDVDILVRLHACDATAFTNVCHNTGQSAAILQGIGALKPVIALSTCRQYRALYADPLGHITIRWVETFADIEASLNYLRSSPLFTHYDPVVAELAAQDSWTTVGRRYADIYRKLVR